MQALFKTDESWAGLILRVALGGVIFAHGAQKLLGCLMAMGGALLIEHHGHIVRSMIAQDFEQHGRHAGDIGGRSADGASGLRAESGRYLA